MTSSFAKDINRLAKWGRLFNGYLAVCWNIVAERVGVFLVVDGAEVMLQTVGDDEIACSQHHVVAHNLVEHLLCDGNRRGFVFGNEQRGAVIVAHQCVAASLDAVEHHRHFV